MRHGRINDLGPVRGVSQDLPLARDWALTSGVSFDAENVRAYAAVTVIGATVARNLFPDGMQPVGEYVLMGGLPVQVIGVLEPTGATSWGYDQDAIALVPVTTAFIRLFCQQYLSSITVRVAYTTDLPTHTPPPVDQR